MVNVNLTITFIDELEDSDPYSIENEGKPCPPDCPLTIYD